VSRGDASLIALATRIGAAAMLVAAATCTSNDGPSRPPSSPSEPADDVVVLPTCSYRIGCDPVPEQMLDVKISNAASSSGTAWAIAGVPASHGIAVPALDACGPFALAVNERLSADAAAAVVDEVRALEVRFGDVPLPA
jgi:hypothetical protein